MPVLRLFAAAREAAGVARVDIDGSTVAEILDAARLRYGERFVAVLGRSRVWVNGQPAAEETPVSGRDVVAVIPPVSGGADTRIAGPAPGAPSPAARSEAPAPTRRPTGPTPPTPPRERPAERGGQGPSGPSERGVQGPSVRSGFSSPAGRPPPSRPPATGPVTVRPRDPSRPAVETGSGNGERAVGSGPAVAPRRSPPPAPVPRVEPRPAAPVAPRRQPDRPSPEPAQGQAPVGEAPSRERSTSRTRVLRSLTPTARQLAVTFTTTRPHGRLGLVWVILLFGAAIAGMEWLAALLGVTALVGACQAVAVRRARGEHGVAALASAIALALPVAAGWGLETMLITAAAGFGLSLLLWALLPSRTTPRDIGITMLIGGTLGAAAASPVLLRDVGLEVALLLLAYSAAYDAGAYLVGTGASYAWEGPAAGMVALIPITIIAAVVLVPPFPAGGPFLLGALAALVTPLGPLAGTALMGDSEADAPGLRRLDSLILLGPVWGAAAVAMS